MPSNTGGGSVNWNSSAPASTGGINWGGESNSSGTGGLNWNSSGGTTAASTMGTGWGGGSTVTTGMSWNTASTAQANGKYFFNKNIPCKFWFSILGRIVSTVYDGKNKQKKVLV